MQVQNDPRAENTLKIDSLVVCKNCISDNTFVRIISNHFIPIEKCSLCLEKNDFGLQISGDAEEILIRYANCILAYFVEDYYTYRSTIPSEFIAIFKANKLLIDFDKVNNNDGLISLFSCIFRPGNGEHAGINEVKVNYYSIKNDKVSDTFYWLRRSSFNLYDLMSAIELIIERIKAHTEILTITNKTFRSRIGCKKHDELGLFEYSIDRDIPYEGEEIGAPPDHLATSGRANRTGFSVLYLAEDIDTSIYETRPNPGDIVSVGQFKQLDETVKIFDLYNHDMEVFYETKEKMDALRIISALNNLFGEPKGTGNLQYYLPTQILCEELMRHGYDGICYKSSFTTKKNYAIFNKEKFKYCENTSELIKIHSMNYKYELLPNKRLAGSAVISAVVRSSR